MVVTAGEGVPVLTIVWNQERRLTMPISRRFRIGSYGVNESIDSCFRGRAERDREFIHRAARAIAQILQSREQLQHPAPA